jgi:hypothetical protein
MMALVTLALVALIATATAGAQGKPIHTQISDSFTENFCGLDLTRTDVGVDNFTPVFDTAGNVVSFADTGSVRTTLTNPLNGKSLVISAAGRHTGTATGDPNGLVTFTDVYKGLPEKISLSDGETLSRDAGILGQVTVVDFSTDPNGVLVSQVSTTEHGPHPDADSNFDLFCNVLTPALS